MLQLSAAKLRKKALLYERLRAYNVCARARARVQLSVARCGDAMARVTVWTGMPTERGESGSAAASGRGSGRDDGDVAGGVIDFELKRQAHGAMLLHPPAQGGTATGTRERRRDRRRRRGCSGSDSDSCSSASSVSGRQRHECDLC